ncbi:MAG: AbrB/MazE/SpoVT family DNA-binding domain-containing protein [Cyclobacteriaceae bacterium]|nr:AbrB/MazE/SpoVT family DNA-binding domain-containing protein [Cyclobacteriaceae bacterium]
MEVKVIKIGNSRGIRLSKTILEKYDINDKVELVLESERIIIRKCERPRIGWEAAFKSMSEYGDDDLLVDDVFDDESMDEWK